MIRLTVDVDIVSLNVNNTSLYEEYSNIWTGGIVVSCFFTIFSSIFKLYTDNRHYMYIFYKLSQTNNSLATKMITAAQLSKNEITIRSYKRFLWIHLASRNLFTYTNFILRAGIIVYNIIPKRWFCWRKLGMDK